MVESRASFLDSIVVNLASGKWGLQTGIRNRELLVRRPIGLVVPQAIMMREGGKGGKLYMFRSESTHPAGWHRDEKIEGALGRYCMLIFFS